MGLRLSVVAAVLMAGLAASPTAQGIYREPFHDTRPVEVVESEPLTPIELDRAMLTLNPVSSSLSLSVHARQRARTGAPPGAIVLRIAFGSDGSMRSFRLVHDDGVGRPLNPIVPPNVWQPLSFHLAPGEPMPGLTAVSTSTPAAVTVERVTDPNGTETWSNPNARELLWKALQESARTNRSPEID